MQEGREVVVAPKVDKDAGHLVVIALTEIDRLRADRLPEVRRRQAKENKQLLRNGLSHVNKLHIFPTIELTVSSETEEIKTVQEQLLLVSTEKLPFDDYEIDYYLNPAGEFLTYVRFEDITILRNLASDLVYMEQVENALLTMKKLVEEAANPHPPLRLVKS